MIFVGVIGICRELYIPFTFVYSKLYITLCSQKLTKKKKTRNKKRRKKKKTRKTKNSFFVPIMQNSEMFRSIIVEENSGHHISLSNGAFKTVSIFYQFLFRIKTFTD